MIEYVCKNNRVAGWSRQNSVRNGGDVYDVFYIPGSYDFRYVYTGIADVHFSEQKVITA